VGWNSAAWSRITAPRVSLFKLCQEWTERKSMFWSARVALESFRVPWGWELQISLPIKLASVPNQTVASVQRCSKHIHSLIAKSASWIVAASHGPVWKILFDFLAVEGCQSIYIYISCDHESTNVFPTYKIRHDMPHMVPGSGKPYIHIAS
jgi:hypothetical protein